MLAPGARVFSSQIDRSIIGVRSQVGPGCRLADTIMMGADYFETDLARIAGVHDTKTLKSDPALALANLFGRLPSSRANLRKSLAAR